MPILLNEGIRKQIQEVFTQLQHPVQILFFGQKEGCNYCDDTRQLIEEVAGLSGKLALSVYDMEDNKDIADQYQIDKTPSLVIAAKDGEKVIDYGIRFAGIPSGHEFSTLIHDLIMVSSRESGLDEETRDFLKTLTGPVHLQVFVTPT